MAWWKHGKRHRLDGPAVVWNVLNGFQERDQEYWVDGQQYSKDEFVQFIDPVTGQVAIPFEYKLRYARL
jgi:hypothetical protein